MYRLHESFQCNLVSLNTHCFIAPANICSPLPLALPPRPVVDRHGQHAPAALRPAPAQHDARVAHRRHPHLVAPLVGHAGSGAGAIEVDARLGTNQNIEQ